MTALEGVGLLLVAILWTLLVDIREHRQRIEKATAEVFRIAKANGASFDAVERSYEDRQPIPPLLGPAPAMLKWDDATARDIARHYAEKRDAELTADLDAYEATELLSARTTAATDQLAILELLREVGGR